MKTQHNLGFTLIELLIVISILAILTGTIGGNYMTSRVRARDAERKTSVLQMQKALEIYFNDYGRYPGSDAGRITPHEDPNTVKDPVPSYAAPIAWGEPFVDNNNSVYMQQLPSDVHAPGSQYMYEVSDDNLKYRLYTRLENTKDIATDLDNDGTAGDYYSGASFGDGTPKVCGSASTQYCNFGIHSTNTTMTEGW